MLLQCLVMPLQWLKLADHCNKSMGSSEIGYLCVYFSEKRGLYVTYEFTLNIYIYFYYIFQVANIL